MYTLMLKCDEVYTPFVALYNYSLDAINRREFVENLSLVGPVLRTTFATDRTLRRRHEPKIRMTSGAPQKPADDRGNLRQSASRGIHNPGLAVNFFSLT